jgi:5-methyltetrahydrofolate--homocysteine methyltransferase
LSPEDRVGFAAETRAEYERVREAYLASQDKRPRLALAAAREKGLRPDFSAYVPPKPSFLGVRDVSMSLAELAPFIDWTPFFASWDLAGRYPAILQDDIVGEAARGLFKDAQAMLARMIDEKWLEARGVVGFFPANRDGDDLVVWSDETRALERARLHTLRQQMDKGADKPNLALADFVAPAGVGDYIGGFAVTAGVGEVEASERFKKANDDYSAIMVKALADRFAEAFAEALHFRVRKELWGFSPEEAFEPAAMIAEQYRGIRPAPGYPAQPDHTEKWTLFDLLDARTRTGMTLTESLAMTPPASVSGLYFSHPQAEYFGVGRIDRDQVLDYAVRKGWDIATAERWLSPILAYDPARDAAKPAGS